MAANRAGQVNRSIEWSAQASPTHALTKYGFFNGKPQSLCLLCKAFGVLPLEDLADSNDDDDDGGGHQEILLLKQIN